MIVELPCSCGRGPHRLDVSLRVLERYTVSDDGSVHDHAIDITVIPSGTGDETSPGI